MTYNEEISVHANTCNNSFIKRHPAIAGIIAISLFAMPIGAIGMSQFMSNAAELEPENQNLQAAYIETSAPVSSTTQNIAALQNTSRIVPFKTVGNGHIEPVSNCTIDGTAGVIDITDKNTAATFKIVPDAGWNGTVKNGSEVLSTNDMAIMLSVNVDYALDITFVANPVPAPVAQPAVDADIAAPAPVADTGSESANSDDDGESYSWSSTTYYTTDRNGTTYSSAPNDSVSTVPNRMTSEERAEAESIFNAYNGYRASKGLNTTVWNEDCANMAYSSATGCAARGTLTHRLGIPANVQNCYSDILQYGTWKMDASTALNNWINSSGHRRQMQCDSAVKAGAAAYHDSNSNCWYFVIVYDFASHNQSGN